MFSIERFIIQRFERLVNGFIKRTRSTKVLRVGKAFYACSYRGGGLYWSFSLLFRFSSATLTASITNAEKVQFLPCIAFSICSITSFGKRMHLLVVGGTEGILNSLIDHHSFVTLLYCKMSELYVLQMYCKKRSFVIEYLKRRTRNENCYWWMQIL